MAFCCICSSLGMIHLESPFRFKFIPQNEKWMKAVENVFNPHRGLRNLFICSLHFEKNSFFYSPNGRIHLRPNAIPTKCLSLYDSMDGGCSKQSYYKFTPEITQQAASSLPPPLVPISHPPLPPLDSTDPLDRFQFLFDNPLLLQDLISIEKLKTFQDDLSVSYGQTIQTVSLRRLSNLISTQRIQIRLTADKLVLVIPTEFVRNYEHVTIDARLCQKDSAPDCLLQVFYDLDTNNFGENGSNCVLLNHNFKLDCWELVGCLAPFYEPPTSPVSPVLCIDTDDSGSQSPTSDETQKESEKPEETVASLPPEPETIPLDLTKKVTEEEASVDSNQAPKKQRRKRNSVVKECPICKKEFFNRKFLTAHIFAHDPSKFTCCQYCNYMSKRKNRVQDHVLKCHAEETKSTDIESSTSNTLPKNVCSVCQNYSGTGTTDFFQHVYSHCSVDMVYCPFCHYFALRKEQMIDHIDSFHEDQPDRSNYLNLFS